VLFNDTVRSSDYTSTIGRLCAASNKL